METKYILLILLILGISITIILYYAYSNLFLAFGPSPGCVLLGTRSSGACGNPVCCNDDECTVKLYSPPDECNSAVPANSQRFNRGECWGPHWQCPGNYYYCINRYSCEGTTCTDQCPAYGYLKCEGNAKWACIYDGDTDPCLEWDYVSHCPEGTTCVEISDTALQCQVVCPNCDYEYCEGYIAWKNPTCQDSVCVRQGIDCSDTNQYCKEVGDTANCVNCPNCDTEYCENNIAYKNPTCQSTGACVHQGTDCTAQGKVCQVSGGIASCVSGTTTIGTTTVQDQPNIIEYSNVGISVIGNKIIVNMYLRNDGASMTQNWLVELQPRPSGVLSWVSQQMTCDPANPQNVHKKYRLNSGESISISLESTVESGSYDIYLVSADSCCPQNPNCVSTSPYHWGVYKKTVTVGEGQCNNNWIWEPGEGFDCPDTIITIVIIGALVSIALIGAYFIRKRK